MRETNDRKIYYLPKDIPYFKKRLKEEFNFDTFVKATEYEEISEVTIQLKGSVVKFLLRETSDTVFITGCNERPEEEKLLLEQFERHDIIKERG